MNQKNDDYGDLMDDLDTSDNFADSGIDDQWDDDALAGNDPLGAVSKPKKKGSTAIIIGAAVLAGLGILYFQFGRGPAVPEAPVDSTQVTEVTGDAAAPPADMAGTALPTDGQPAPAGSAADINALQNAAPVEAAPTPEAPKETGFLNDDAALAAPENGPSLPTENTMTATDVAAQPLTPMPTAVSAEAEAAALQPVTNAVPVAEAAQNASASPEVQALSPMDAIKKAEPSPEAEKSGEVPVVSSLGAPVKAEDVDDTKTLVLEGQLKDAQDKIAELEKKLEQAQSSAPVVSDDTAAMQDRIKDLEKQLASSQKSSSVAKTSTTRKATTKSSVTSVRSSGWVLKSAQPGQAWIAKKGDTSGDLNSVSVGENIEGIGRVTSIEQVNGVWTIKATRGVIRQ